MDRWNQEPLPRSSAQNPSSGNKIKQWSENVDNHTAIPRQFLKSPFEEISRRAYQPSSEESTSPLSTPTLTPIPRPTARKGEDPIQRDHQIPQVDPKCVGRRFPLPSKPAYPTSANSVNPNPRPRSNPGPSNHFSHSHDEETSTITATSQITVHPYFPPSSDHDQPHILIKSDDGVGYYLPLEEARGMYKAIKDQIQELGINRNRNRPDKKDIQVSELEKAGSDSLTLILTTLLQPERFISPKSTDPMILIKLLPQALEVSSIYVIPKFFNCFTSLLIKLNASPLVLYTAFALKDDMISARKYSTQTLRSEYLNKIPLTIQQILQDHVPSYLTKLENLHSRWSVAYNELYHSFSVDLGVNIRLEGFGSKCKKRYGRGCPGYTMYGGSFTKLRTKAAEAASQISRDNVYRSMNPVVEESIHEAVKCETCAHRFINAFDAVMRRVFEGLNNSI